MKTLNQDELWSLFDYNEQTGDLIWKKQLSNKGPIGAIAGYVNDNGYLMIGFNNEVHRAHRIVWAMHYAQEDGDIDHIDGNKTNNRLNNLRPATRTQNNWNSKIRSDNTTVYKGVSLHQGKWRVRIFVNGKEITKSGFNTKQEAISYAEQIRESTQGEFAKHY